MPEAVGCSRSAEAAWQLAETLARGRRWTRASGPTHQVAEVSGRAPAGWSWPAALWVIEDAC